ncbi:serine/threonine-protein kinase [Falsiroseomonas bella]|uniref:serine/threonine-protein kinase n=1 Tax=Falsiroseomonas bella TaxID=2184016 RepID=UPI001E379497|nr:serine/threonine-protein kinase [Falsiroseomonas bella]
MIEPGGNLGKYELRSTLGRGAMGVVYEGWDPVIARRVAIKTVRLPAEDDTDAQEELARFRREAQAAGRLTHPNIVGVYDYGEDRGVAYIVMEFVDGPTLKSLLDRQERMALPQVVRVMEEVLAGLAFSHARGIVHRDIKPANVMLTSEGQAKLADFGIARIESSSMTQAGTVMGTPAYMSPEQFMGQTVDARTDIYSAGVLLYQLLTGERPFEGGMAAIMHKALNTEAPKPSDLSVTAPPALDAVVARAMAKRPDGRFPNAEAFAVALRAALAAPAPSVEATMIAAPGMAERSVEATMIASSAAPPAPTATVPTAPAPPPVAAPAPAATPTPRQGAPIGAIAAGVAALVAIGGGAWFMLGREAPQAPPQATAVQQPPAAPAPLPPPISVTAQPAPAPAAPPPTVVAAPAPAPSAPLPAAPAPSPAPPVPAVTAAPPMPAAPAPDVAAAPVPAVSAPAQPAASPAAPLQPAAVAPPAPTVAVAPDPAPSAPAPMVPAAPPAAEAAPAAGSPARPPAEPAPASPAPSVVAAPASPATAASPAATSPAVPTVAVVAPPPGPAPQAPDATGAPVTATVAPQPGPAAEAPAPAAPPPTASAAPSPAVVVAPPVVVPAPSLGPLPQAPAPTAASTPAPSPAAPEAPATASVAPQPSPGPAMPAPAVAAPAAPPANAGNQAPQVLALGPVPPQPPVMPAPAQPAALPPAAVARAALAAALPSVTCSLVHGTATAERVTLQGIVGRGAPERALRATLASGAGTLPSDWRVATFDAPFCTALDTIRPVAQPFGTAGAMTVALAGEATRLRDGELVTVVVNGPDFPAYVYVSFLVHDGTLAHLHPTPTDPARRLPAFGSLRLGDPAIGGPAWAVGPPYGKDLVIAVASSVPLFDRPRPDDEDTGAYLRALRTALEQARRRGATLAADAWLLETVAR